ncbi:hypothetical protein AX17_007231 [Amanita inopinata Kibby_2008]|nr:hypothetical protein AX17_007231 [Amanita inopinata Kibby_2008]
MFYYLSFLRPPPAEALPSRTISITPQIANDLRTEHYESEKDIFYSWVQVTTSKNQSQGGSPQATITKPAKLTTWRRSSAYKQIQVPVPTRARAGQSWQLMLSCTAHPPATLQVHVPTPEACTINLGADDLGNVPFPVLSMPIKFVSKLVKGGVTKQEKIERMYTFLLPNPRHASLGDAASSIGQLPAPNRVGENMRPIQATIRVTEQTSFDLDKKIWDSGIGLSSWLVQLAHGGLQRPSTSGSDESLKFKLLRNALFGDKPSCFLELGTGTGIVALTLGALRGALATSHMIERSASRIIATDLATAMPLLEHNIAMNCDFFPEKTGVRPEALVLDWDDEGLPEYVQTFATNADNETRGFNVIIMADVTYNTTSFPSLVRTLSKLVQLGEESPYVLLGYKERDSAERTLWDMVRQEANIDFLLLGSEPGAGGAPIEIWMGEPSPLELVDHLEPFAVRIWHSQQYEQQHEDNE